MVKLYADSDITSVSLNGKQYDFVDGEIDVADEEVSALVSEFGFISVPVEVPAAVSESRRARKAREAAEAAQAAAESDAPEEVVTTETSEEATTEAVINDE